MFERLETHDEALGASAVEMLLAGVSTRRVGERLERIRDLPISAGQVSRLAKRLDGEVRAFHTREIADDFVYLLRVAYFNRNYAGRVCPTLQKKRAVA